MLTGYAPKEPDSIESGTTVLFERALGQYPASAGWFLSYSIIGLGQTVTFQSVADGDSHAVTIPSTTTALWLPTNTSKLAGYAINNTLTPPQTFQIYFQLCPVLPNLVNPPPDQPSKTFLEEMICQMEALLKLKGTDDLLVAHIGDQSFKFESKADIWRQLCEFRAHRRVEIARERARNGKPPLNRSLPVAAITPPGPLYGNQWISGYNGAY